jgi:predicted DNA-binding protein (MmcQ/YjbR family)
VSAPASDHRRVEATLRTFALEFPEAHEDFPWGERVIKVRARIFVFLGRVEGRLHVTVKLPGSSSLALDLPFVSPTGYGLGKSGWVTARFGPGARPPVPMLKQWIDESYRAVAPKRLALRLTAPRPAGQGSAARRGASRAPARLRPGRR